MTHRLHSRVRHLERKARRTRPKHRRGAWFAVKYPADAEIEIANEAHGTLDQLRSALAAITERFTRWRARHPTEPGMPLKNRERETVGEALKCADYVTEFGERFPHRDDEGVPCAVVAGDAEPELLARRPADTMVVVWQIVEPVLSPEDAATAEAARRRRSAAETALACERQGANASALGPMHPEIGADSKLNPPMTPDEERRARAREAFERQSHPDTRWRGIDHAPHADTEFREARRQRRVDVRELSFFNKPRHRS